MSVAINSSPAGALNNSQSSWKRRGSDDEDDRQGDNVKKAKYSWYVTLESESSVPTDEDEESIYTLQGNETEFARDTSDTSTTHTWVSSNKSDVSFHVEYELDSRSENENPFMDLSSSSEPENILAVGFITFCDSDGLADDSDASRSSMDSEIKRADFRICIQCKNPNSNPLFRYCEKCYQVRKTHFPRTRPKRKARSKKERSQRTSSLTTSSVTSGQELCEMDSGIASSQDLERLTSDSVGSETPIFDSQGSDVTTVSGTSIGTMSSGSTTRFIVDSSLDRDEVDSSFAPKGCRSNDISVYSPITSSSTSGLNSTKDKTDESRDEPGSSNSSITFVDSSISACELKNKKLTTSKEEHGNVTDSVPKSETESERQLQGSDSLCRICVVIPKNSVFVHGNTGHIYCCYGCARKVWSTNDHRCPICNRKVTQIIKAFTD